ncbi:MAG: alpha/beta hydrolase [Sulfitobacter sp.]|nr:alpha/beta hydrolase [Sulfitobacter sp.]
MAKPSYLSTKSGRRLAYHRTEGEGPCILFLGGLKSDMEGTKAIFLEDWARREGRNFLRFDYSGHGESSGDFTDGCIGDWAEDTAAIVSDLIQGPILPLGSSMGGWQALLLALAMPERIAGLVTIAAAPHLTEDIYWAGVTEEQKAALARDGQVELPSDYMEPYIITERMIADGRRNLVLRAPLSLPFPVRFLQGTADTAVSVDLAVRLLEHAQGPDMQLRLVKDADHRFSDDRCLALILEAIGEVLGITIW